jgi:outer membrane protein assembly factor BamB
MCLYQDMVIACDHTTKTLVAVREGKVLWRTEGIAFANSVSHYDGEIMLGAIDGVYFLDPVTGVVLRRIEMERAHCPNFNEEVIVVQSKGGFYNCFDRKTLELRWSTDFGELGKTEMPHDRTIIKRGSIACRSPLIVNERIYAASSYRIVAFDLKTGELLWMTKMLGQLQEVLYRNGRLYGMADSCFRVFDPETGEVLLQKQHPDECGGGNMPFMAGKILFNNEKRIQAVDIETGEMVWSYADKRKTVGFTGQPVYLDGRLYAADTAGCLYCFGHEG